MIILDILDAYIAATEVGSVSSILLSRSDFILFKERGEYYLKREVNINLIITWICISVLLISSCVVMCSAL